MRLRNSIAVIALSLMLASGLGLRASLAQEANEAAPTDAEIVAALDKVRADPNLSGERKTRTLRWVRGNDKPQELSGFLAWIKNFFVWLGQISRVLVWVVGALLATALVWFVITLIKGMRMPVKKPHDATPTHVRDLDIRPESLPDDIGAAALALWNQGEHRAALALLYRGLLSRLVHVHRVPIRDSSTEGDCVMLAAKYLPEQRSQFVKALVQTWQRATYGAHEPQSETVQALCTEFDSAVGAALPERSV